MERKFLIVLIAVAVLAFVVGGGLGIFYQSQISGATVPKAKAVQALSSKIVPSIVAYGKVSEIKGREVTLTSGTDSLTIKIKDNAKIFIPSTSTDGGQATQQKIAKFEDIKKGGNLSINLKLFTNGQIEGDTVIILP